MGSSSFLSLAKAYRQNFCCNHASNNLVKLFSSFIFLQTARWGLLVLGIAYGYKHKRMLFDFCNVFLLIKFILSLE